MSTDHDGSWLPGADDPLDRRDLLVRAGGVGALVALGGLAGASRAIAEPTQNVGKVTAYFGQFGAIAEQEGIRKYVFKGFRGDVDPVFVPITAPTQFVDRVRAEAKAGKGNIDLLVGLHGDMVTFQNEGLIRGIDDVAKQVKTLPPALVKIGKLGTSTQYYLPHSQATYVMVANKDVLKYMPKGTDINAITYGQVYGWAKAIRKGTGQSRFGLPASSTGLIHRFLQGFLGTVVQRRLRHELPLQGRGARVGLPAAALAVHASAVPDVRVHAGPAAERRGAAGLGSRRPAEDGARPASRRPHRVPGPEGPKSRSYMPVIVGMAIPKNAPNPAGGKALMQHMLRISAQAQILSIAGFFPVVGGNLSKSISPGLRAEAAAVRRQQKANDAVQALLPIGIGAEGGNFNKIYIDTFTRIVRNGENIQTVLNEQGALLQQIFDKTGAPCSGT